MLQTDTDTVVTFDSSKKPPLSKQPTVPEKNPNKSSNNVCDGSFKELPKKPFSPRSQSKKQRENTQKKQETSNIKRHPALATCSLSRAEKRRPLEQSNTVVSDNLEKQYRCTIQNLTTYSTYDTESLPLETQVLSVSEDTEKVETEILLTHINDDKDESVTLAIPVVEDDPSIISNRKQLHENPNMGGIISDVTNEHQKNSCEMRKQESRKDQMAEVESYLDKEMRAMKLKHQYQGDSFALLKHELRRQSEISCRDCPLHRLKKATKQSNTPVKYAMPFKQRLKNMGFRSRAIGIVEDVFFVFIMNLFQCHTFSRLLLTLVACLLHLFFKFSTYESSTIIDPTPYYNDIVKHMMCSQNRSYYT